jgi:hypothetical protein
LPGDVPVIELPPESVKGKGAPLAIYAVPVE